MNTQFMENGKQELPNETEQEGVTKYEYAGYQIRVHFTGKKTLAQCIKNLTEKRIEC